MAWDISVALPNAPGALASAAEALAAADINIDGSCAVLCNGEGVVHFLIEGDHTGAKAALGAAGVEVRSEQEVVVVELEDRPGALGQATRRLADAGVNIELQYLATRTRAVFGADDVEAARQALA
jgi:hypothetical protein